MIKKLFLPLLFITSISFFTACDPEEPVAMGEIEIEITDAPVDDANVKGVIVTVAEVRLDGKTYEGFEGKQTIDLLAYQNGETKLLGMNEVEAKTYNEITLVLDYARDTADNTPGSYVLTQDNRKIALRDGSAQFAELDLTGDFTVAADQKSEFVIDFDLRKALTREDDNYEFVSEDELAASLRVVDRAQVGTINGTFESSIFAENDKVVVFAYEQGTFDEERETEKNANGLAFQNAISSTLATKSGNDYAYTLAFLEEGDYEICIAAYDDDDNDGEFEFEGFLQASIMLDGSVTTPVTIAPGLSTDLTLSIIGLIQ